MEQVFEGTPQAEIRLEGRKLIRTEVAGDWGSKLVWQISRDGQPVASVNARPDLAYEHPDKTAGKYEVVLQLFKYEGYQKDKDRKFIKSKYVDVSNKVSYTV
jgi:hypothetical protein